METTNLTPELFRVCDANLNRLREGVRVVEDILRYCDNNKNLSSKLKNLRHKARIKENTQLLQNRDIINDVLRSTTKSELKRESIENIITANFKRAEESARVLEEIFKLYNNSYSENFKHIRYELYDLEKEIVLSR